MNYEVVVSDEAKLDIKEIQSYYAKVSDDLLLKFMAELTESVDLIAANPQQFQKRYRDIKIVFTKKFPFGIHYIFENNTVYIQRILHQKRFYK